MPSPDDLLTAGEVAAMKKANVRSVYRAVKEERLKADRRGHILLIRRGDAEAWPAKGGRYKKEGE